MNMERAVLKGQLAELNEKRIRLEGDITANLSAVQMLMAGWRIRKFSEIDIESALSNLQEAARQKQDLMATRNDIKKVEAELE